MFTRRHLFELTDEAWAPEALRALIIESLGRTLRWGRMLRGVVEPLLEFTKRHKIRRVLDLASGSGVPVELLIEEFLRRGETPPQFVLTDLYPRTGQWEKLRMKYPTFIDYVAKPVDATSVPHALRSTDARLMINAFHHLSPSLANDVLRNAVVNQVPMMVVEPFDRDPRAFWKYIPVGLPALLSNPLVTRNRAWQQALLLYGSPMGIVAALWDGTVSTLRMYTEEDLRAMVAPYSEDYRWEWLRHDYRPFGSGTLFFGASEKVP